MIFSFDCFMETSVGKPLPRFYMYLLIYCLMPACISFFVFLFWRLRYLRSTEKMSVRLLQTLLIVFFLIHPSVTRVLLQAFE